MKSKNQSQLESFADYCKAYPEERFWQALRNWSHNAFVLTANNFDFETGQYININDTFYNE